MILVIGGTGGFGSTICRLLKEDGHVVVAGARDERRGRTFAVANTGIGFVAIDRDAVTADRLEGYDVVVDAAGPFRSQDRRLARAAIAAGCHHIDISDDRDFTRGACKLDRRARAAGVACISGASSVPALSSAVALELAEGMDEVSLVEIAISASSRAAFGRSVLHSMLSGAGRPIHRCDGTRGVAMDGPRPMVVRHAGGRTMTRTVLEVDGPDHDALPRLLPGRPAVRFHAGGEMRLHNRAMMIVSRMVARGRLRDGSHLLPLARAARHLTSRFGDGRSGMTVRLHGRRDGRARCREWSLVAKANTGPVIPCLVVPALVRAIADGRIAPGAGTAAGLLGVDEILSRMPDGAITVETRDRTPPSAYSSMPGFAQLAPAVRAMHDVPTVPVARGRADIVRGRGMAANLVARVFGFPPGGGDVPVSVEFEPWGAGERWTRDFGGRRFSSVLTSAGRGVRERFGPFTFRFRLEERDGALEMVPRSWRFAGVRLPRRLMPDGVATEREEDGRFHFDVPIRVPLVGLVVHYRGWLEPVDRGGTD